MKNLRLRNIFFSPDGRGNGKINDAEKGPEIAVGRKELKEKIKNGEPTIVIPAEDGRLNQVKEEEK